MADDCVLEVPAGEVAVAAKVDLQLDRTLALLGTLVVAARVVVDVAVVAAEGRPCERKLTLPIDIPCIVVASFHRPTIPRKPLRALDLARPLGVVGSLQMDILFLPATVVYCLLASLVLFSWLPRWPCSLIQSDLCFCFCISIHSHGMVAVAAGLLLGGARLTSAFHDQLKLLHFCTYSYY